MTASNWYLPYLFFFSFLDSVSAVTLEDVLNSVDQHYPEVLSAGAKAQAKEYLITRSRGAFDPVLSASLNRTNEGTYQNAEQKLRLQTQIPETGVKVGAEWSDLDGKVPVYEGARITGTEGRLKGFVEVPLLRDLLIDRARASLDSAIFSYSESVEQARLVRMDTYRIAAMSYWSWAAATERQHVYENLLKIAEERDQVIGKRVKRGEAPRIEGVDNARIILQRKSQLEKAKLEAQKATLVLSLFYRNEKGNPIRPEVQNAPQWLKPLPETQPEQIDSLRESLKQHPSVKATEFELDQKRVSQRLAKYSLLPQLDFKAAHSNYMGGLTPPRDISQETTLGLQFSIPLFNREARGAHQATKLETEATEQKLKLVQQKLDVDFEKAHLESNTAAQIYRYVFQEIDLATQVESAERVRFQHGDSSLLNVNLREQDTVLARIRAIESLLEYNQKNLELHLVSNTWLRKY